MAESKRMDLTGKKALVTGASKGVGKGIALFLAECGCDVAVNFNSDESGAAQTAQSIIAKGRQAFPIQANVGHSDAASALVQSTVQKLGGLDILVNNAGVQTWKPLLELAEEEWDRTINTNLKGTFLCTQAAARLMKETGGGRIINIGSGCNKIAFPNLVDYTASKGGLEMFTKVAALELARYKITVNCVAPGAIEIERTQQEARDYSGTWAKVTPLKRVGTPEDIGKAVAFLASNEADFVTGQTIWVDGGLFSHPVWPY